MLGDRHEEPVAPLGLLADPDPHAPRVPRVLAVVDAARGGVGAHAREQQGHLVEPRVRDLVRPRVQAVVVAGTLPRRVPVGVERLARHRQVEHRVPLDLLQHVAARAEQARTRRVGGHAASTRRGLQRARSGRRLDAVARVREEHGAPRVEVEPLPEVQQGGADPAPALGGAHERVRLAQVLVARQGTADVQVRDDVVHRGSGAVLGEGAGRGGAQDDEASLRLVLLVVHAGEHVPRAHREVVVPVGLQLDLPRDVRDRAVRPRVRVVERGGVRGLHQGVPLGEDDGKGRAGDAAHAFQRGGPTARVSTAIRRGRTHGRPGPLGGPGRPRERAAGAADAVRCACGS